MSTEKDAFVAGWDMQRQRREEFGHAGEVIYAWRDYQRHVRQSPSEPTFPLSVKQAGYVLSVLKTRDMPDHACRECVGENALKDGLVCVRHQLAAWLKSLQTPETTADEAEHRCSGCGYQWAAPVRFFGAELCGDCWRKAQPLVQARKGYMDDRQPMSLAEKAQENSHNVTILGRDDGKLVEQSSTLKQQILDILNEDLSPWTFSGDEPLVKRLLDVYSSEK